MPFRDVATHFEPEQLDKLTAAFDTAWPQLLLAIKPETHLKERLLRQRLAHYILATASTGQFQPEILTEQALRALIYRGSPPIGQKIGLATSPNIVELG